MDVLAQLLLGGAILAAVLTVLVLALARAKDF